MYTNFIFEQHIQTNVGRKGCIKQFRTLTTESTLFGFRLDAKSKMLPRPLGNAVAVVVTITIIITIVIIVIIVVVIAVATAYMLENTGRPRFFDTLNIVCV